LLLLSWLLSGDAFALPEFAARNTMRCLQCHESPSGGGPRNAFGRTFAVEWLPIGSDVGDWIQPEDEARIVPFDGTITDWLAVGADMRTAYLLTAPSGREVESSFFLMQADLYHSIQLGAHLSAVLDIGIYSGLEAYATLRPIPDVTVADILVRAGRFLPAVGIKFANHTLFTREGVGLGPAAQDTGVEVAVDTAYFGLQIALVNGTLGDPFDVPRSDRRAFDKAIAARADGKLALGPVRLSIGGSFYTNQSFDRPNPMFAARIDAAEAAPGVDEIRAGGFLTFNVGRLSILADAIYVKDRFTLAGLAEAEGFALYGELHLLALRGVEILAGFELRDADLEAHVRDGRGSLAVEVFPFPFTEIRAMVRHQRGDSGPITDATLFLHVFL
jgi:hypothetical protein